MAERSLEERVCLLEQELTQVKRQLAAPQTKQEKDWLSTFGAFADDPLFDEIVQAGREYRQSDRSCVSPAVPKGRP